MPTKEQIDEMQDIVEHLGIHAISVEAQAVPCFEELAQRAKKLSDELAGFKPEEGQVYVYQDKGSKREGLQKWAGGMLCHDGAIRRPLTLKECGPHVVSKEAFDKRTDDLIKLKDALEHIAMKNFDRTSAGNRAQLALDSLSPESREV